MTSTTKLLVALATVLALSVSGCKKEDEGASAGGGGGSGDGRSSSPAAEEINLFAWSEYVPRSVIDKFEEETKIRVNYEEYASNEDMLAKLGAGATKYDLIQPSEYTVEALVKAKELAELSWDNIPNLKNIDAKYKNLGH